MYSEWVITQIRSPQGDLCPAPTCLGLFPYNEPLTLSLTYLLCGMKKEPQIGTLVVQSGTVESRIRGRKKFQALTKTRDTETEKNK